MPLRAARTGQVAMVVLILLLASSGNGSTEPAAPAPDTFLADLRVRLAAALPAFRDAATLLRNRVDFPPAEQPRIRAALLPLLARARRLPPSERVLFLLAADRLGEDISDDAPYNAPSDSEWQRFRAQVAVDGMSFERDPLAGGWLYHHSLLRRIWEESPDAPWSEEAFVALLDAGWTVGFACEDGNDDFRRVIEQGERFLAARPRASLAPAVRLRVAEAYETWWSLSLATPSDCCANAERYIEGATTARDMAIKLYAEVERQATRPELRAHARRARTQLRAGRDPEQRRFFCYYD